MKEKAYFSNLVKNYSAQKSIYQLASQLSFLSLKSSAVLVNEIKLVTVKIINPS